MVERRCPVWVGYLLASPMRRLFQNPDAILSPFVRPGMTALDVGPAMGFFSVPMARMVGSSGRVVCVDVQRAMLEKLSLRAARAGVANRLETRVCDGVDFALGDLDGTVDFALAFAVVHEMTDSRAFFAAARRALKPGAKLLVAEPRGHVSADAFAETLGRARDQGFESMEPPRISRCRAALLDRPAEANGVG